MHTDASGALGIRAAFKTVPSNVCGHRHFHRQRAAEKGEDLRAMDGASGEEGISCEANAGADAPNLAASAKAVDTSEASCGPQVRRGPLK